MKNKGYFRADEMEKVPGSGFKVDLCGHIYFLTPAEKKMLAARCAPLLILKTDQAHIEIEAEKALLEMRKVRQLAGLA